MYLGKDSETVKSREKTNGVDFFFFDFFAEKANHYVPQGLGRNKR
jgi:hypothetical protein